MAIVILHSVKSTLPCKSTQIENAWSCKVKVFTVLHYSNRPKLLLHEELKKDRMKKNINTQVNSFTGPASRSAVIQTKCD